MTTRKVVTLTPEIIISCLKNPPDGSFLAVITPEVAKWILGNIHDGNRTKRHREINRVAQEMIAGDYPVTGETIIFTKWGLGDGQHRLQACIKAGVPFETHVIFGIETKAIKKVDSRIGGPRTPEDFFKINSVPYSSDAAKATRWLMLSDNPEKRTSFNGETVWNFYEQNVDAETLTEAIRLALKASKVLPKTSVAAYLYIFMKRNKKAALKFASSLVEPGSGNGRVLVNKVKRVRETGEGNINEAHAIALLIHTWNADQAGNSLSLKGHNPLVYRIDDPFPQIA